MRSINNLMVLLNPFSPCSFRRRFFAVLIAWGIPFALMEFFYLKLYRYPSELPFALALQVPSIVVGALGVALLEHLIHYLASRNAEGRNANSSGNPWHYS